MWHIAPGWFSLSFFYTEGMHAEKWHRTRGVDMDPDPTTRVMPLNRQHDLTRSVPLAWVFGEEALAKPWIKYPQARA